MEDNLLTEMSEGFLIIYTMYKEEKIASYTAPEKRIQLLKITEEKYASLIEEISNSVGGYIAIWSDGQKMKIKDNEVETLAKAWNLKKDNENYYYKERSFEGEYKTKYQIRVNRKIVENTISEGTARRRFAGIVTSEILQQKFSF